MTEQMQHWSCCQICGRTVARGHPDWIDAPLRNDDRGLRVVRCPMHWSEWALRNSIGRTNANREKMRELKGRYLGLPMTSNPMIEPFPVVDEPPSKGMNWRAV